MWEIDAMFRLFISLAVLALAASAFGQMPPENSPNEFRISGAAVNAVTGQALSKIEISIGPAEGPGQTRSMVTAADGRFNFDNLASRKYWLAAQAHGFSMQRFDQHGEFSSAIAVGLDKNSENLVFRIFPDATIVGTITDDQTDPLVGAQVMLFRTAVQKGESSTRLRTQTMADDQGRYHLAHVPEGTYYIAVSARPWYAENNPSGQRVSFSVGGRANQTALSNSDSAEESQFDVTYPLTFYPGVTDPTAATSLTVKPGDRLTADLSLSAVPALQLRVMDSDIAPPTPGSRLTPLPFGVNLSERIFGATVPIPTDFGRATPGEIEINGLPPGDFTLRVQTFGKNPSSREKQISVSDSSEIDTADASGLASVTGIVQLDNGGPLSRPVVVQFANSSGDNFAVRTSEKGEFQLSEVRPGKYELSVFGIRAVFVKNIEATGTNVIGRQVEVGADASIQLKITLSEGVGRIDGTAQLNGKPFAGAMIVLVPQDIVHNAPLVRRDQSDSDGTFSLYRVLPGTYNVIAIQNGWDLQWMSPDVLQPHLKGGEVVTVSPHGRYDIKVNVE